MEKHKYKESRLKHLAFENDKNSNVIIFKDLSNPSLVDIHLILNDDGRLIVMSDICLEKLIFALERMREVSNG